MYCASRNGLYRKVKNLIFLILQHMTQVDSEITGASPSNTNEGRVTQQKSSQNTPPNKAARV